MLYPLLETPALSRSTKAFLVDHDTSFYLFDPRGERRKNQKTKNSIKSNKRGYKGCNSSYSDRLQQHGYLSTPTNVVRWLGRHSTCRPCLSQNPTRPCQKRKGFHSPPWTGQHRKFDGFWTPGDLDPGLAWVRALFRRERTIPKRRGQGS